VLAFLPQNKRVLVLDELSEEYKKRPLENPAFEPKNKKRKSNPLASPTPEEEKEVALLETPGEAMTKNTSFTQGAEAMTTTTTTTTNTSSQGAEAMLLLASLPLPTENVESSNSEERSDAPHSSSSEVSETTRRAAERIVRLKKNQQQKPKPRKNQPAKKPAKKTQKNPKSKPVKEHLKPVKEHLKPGTRVAVFWSKEDTQNNTEAWYKGVVRRYEEDKVIVLYDGDEESIAEDEYFANNDWKILDDEA